MKNILLISGSLRKVSANTLLLNAMAAHARKLNTVVHFYDELALLPAFNPEEEFIIQNESVKKFKKMILASSAIIISSPEYAHGVPGALKNALDWMVGSGELMNKPTGIITVAGSGGNFAHQQLLEICKTMSAQVIDGGHHFTQTVKDGNVSDSISLVDRLLAIAI